MLSYKAYGLGIRSELPLPELIEGEGPADIIVRFGRVACATWQDAPEGFHRYHANAKEIFLQYEEVGTFLAREGREIVVEPWAGAEERELRAYVLGPSLGVLLHQRGLLTLHASAVSINGEAVAFLGGSGWGKSTTAAALSRRGHPLVADDVLALTTDCQQSTQVLSAFPRLKLWPDAAAAIGDRPEDLPRISARHNKRERYAGDGFSLHPLPLRRIYVLGRGATQEIEPLSRQEACIELVRHSFCVRLLRLTGERSSHFLRCAALAARAQVFRLRLRPSLEALPHLAETLENNLVVAR